MILGPGEVLCPELPGLQALVDVALEGENRLLGTLEVVGRLPFPEATVVQVGKLRADAHEFGYLAGLEFAEGPNQEFRELEKVRLGAVFGSCGGIEIESLGW